MIAASTIHCVAWSYDFSFKLFVSFLDTDECLYNQYICGYGHQCINTPGGYTCRCQMGYIYDKEKKQCVGELFRPCPHIYVFSVESTTVRQGNYSIPLKLSQKHCSWVSIRRISDVQNWFSRLLIAYVSITAFIGYLAGIRAFPTSFVCV